MATTEYRINITFAEHGAEAVAEDNMEAFTEGFALAFPAAGAVAAADHSRDALDVTFSVDSEDARSAINTGIDMFAEVASTTSLEPSAMLDITVHPAGESHEASTGEFVYA